MEKSLVSSVYVALHGDKFNGPNPGMTQEGFDQVAALRPLLPQEPSVVVCGMGKRHLDVASALGLTPTRYTPNVGGPESLEKIAGQVCVVLADGTAIPRNLYSGTDDGKTAMVAVVTELPHDAVICAGRPSMILLGVGNAKSASIYQVDVENGKIVAITEVVATGVSEAGTV